MEAGARLLSSEGYHQTSSKKIARAAGISVGSFYNHFRDKKELLLAVYREHVARVHQMIFDALQGGGLGAGLEGRRLVEAVVGQALRLHTLSPEFHRQMMALRHTDEDVGRVVAEEDERVVRLLMEMLSSSNSRRLRVDDLEAAARVVIIAVEEVVHGIKVSVPPPIGEERLIAALSDMVHRFLFR